MSKSIDHVGDVVVGVGTSWKRTEGLPVSNDRPSYLLFESNVFLQLLVFR